MREQSHFAIIVKTPENCAIVIITTVRLVFGIIDDTGGVGVLEIDGQREVMLRADEAAAIGFVERR